MKKNQIIGILLIISVFLVGNVYGQEIRTVTTTETKHLVEVEDGLYKVLIKNDESKLRQVGFYKEHVGGSLLKEGLWKMYDDDGSLMVTASFKDNKLVWIKPRDDRRYTSKEIEEHRSRRRSESFVSN